MIRKASVPILFRTTDGRSLSDNLLEGIRIEVLRAANAYLQVLLNVNNVPVWTGRLHNSFKPLYDRLKQENIRTSFKPARPTSTARDYFESIGGRDSLGTVTEDLSRYTDIYIPKKGGSTQITFTFRNEVPYYGGNDFAGQQPVNVKWGLRKATPWNSQEKAIEAFTDRLENNIPRISSRIILREMNSVLLPVRGNSDKTASKALTRGWGES